MKIEIENILFENHKLISNRLREKYFIKHYFDLYNSICQNNVNYSFIENVYIIINEIKPPLCKVCNNKVSLISFPKGFKVYCSKECVQSDPSIKESIKKTNLKKYGVDNPNKSKDVIDKRKKTNLKKYGVEHGLQSNIVKEKIIETNNKKYGVDNPFQSDIIKERIKKTNIIKYGVEHNSLSPEIVSKRKKTFLIKYGVDNPNKSKNVINKRTETIIYNYRLKYSNILGIDVDDITTNINDDVIISNYCDKHSSFKIGKQNLINRLNYGIENICTKCNPISLNPTIKENELVTFIDSLGVVYERNNRKILLGKEIDIYIPELNIGIEFNGLYWHSNKFQNKYYHLNKTNDCLNKGIQLIHIFEDEWINKKEIVKSIIKSKLNILDERIYGRKCEVKEISDNNLIKTFLNDNHIQGHVNSLIKLGLFHNNELVSIMTFGKKRIALGGSSNEGDYEMLRFCNKLNTSVIGGGSKLLKYFIKTFSPNNILTFADRRYSNGNLYLKLGFKLIGETEPNYWYFKKNDLIRYHRYKFRKDILVKEGYDSNKTEKQIMLERNYKHIYDSGNLKYVMNL